jgi:hypothetical protein
LKQLATSNKQVHRHTKYSHTWTSRHGRAGETEQESTGERKSESEREPGRTRNGRVDGPRATVVHRALRAHTPGRLWEVPSLAVDRQRRSDGTDGQWLWNWTGNGNKDGGRGGEGGKGRNGSRSVVLP